MSLKRYVITKMVMAKTAREAIKKEKNYPVDEVNLEKEWFANSTNKEIKGFEAK